MGNKLQQNVIKSDYIFYFKYQIYVGINKCIHKWNDILNTIAKVLKLIANICICIYILCFIDGIFESNNTESV